jgi:hypothetical protein
VFDGCMDVRMYGCLNGFMVVWMYGRILVYIFVYFIWIYFYVFRTYFNVFGCILMYF